MNLFEPLQPPTHPLVGSGHALPPGSLLEEFEVTQVLGLTGFGVLYLATHTGDQREVVLKEYMPSAIASRNAEGQIEVGEPSHQLAFERGLQSFIGESLTLSQFDHPHLLHVSCVWEGHGTAYRAMPHLKGESLLAQRTAATAPASQAQLQTLFDGLLSALETLHGAGFAHGQIEPSNVFMRDGEHPVLMDFDSVHHAVLSDALLPYVDTYADPDASRQVIVSDLQAVAALLHFAIGGQWLPPGPTSLGRHEPLAEALARFKDSASVLGYVPEFLSAIDAVLAAAPAARPASVAEFRALFAPKPPVTPASKAQAAAPVLKVVKPVREPVRPMPERTESEYPLNSSESVLALLAGFDRRPSEAVDDIEPFENPVVPTLTEEAEPALPPMRTSLFDAMDAGEALPEHGVSYGRNPHREHHYDHTPAPTTQAFKDRRRQRLVVIAGIVTLVVACVGALGWQLMS